MDDWEAPNSPLKMRCDVTPIMSCFFRSDHPAIETKYRKHTATPATNNDRAALFLLPLLGYIILTSDSQESSPLLRSCHSHPSLSSLVHYSLPRISYESLGRT
jgi:hypothetical protein